MGPKAVAEQIQSSGMSIPGFRRDPKIIEKVMTRYIPKVTVIGGAFIGVLAVTANFLGTIGNVGGTSLLLAVSIVYRLYEQLANEQVMEMHPMLRRFLGEA
jgi:preprotein translocase subunit SecY